MNAVGRLGSYISRGVYTVSGPFHPFGGCVDIIVVEQQDGTFKSSPWYVRFGKFQGVLKTREKVVNISVNGSEASFHMYLDHKGEAYFLREVDEVGESESLLNNSSSGDEEAEGAPTPQGRDVGAGNGNVVTRTNSHRTRILGLVFGQKSRKESDGGAESNVKRTDSLERAEFAANLLEVKWSTNLDTNKPMIDNASRFCDPSALEGRQGEDVVRIDGSSSCVEENGSEVSSAVTIDEGVRTSNDVEDNSVELQVFPAKQSDEEDEVFDRSGIGGVSSQRSVSQDSGTHKVQSFIFCESSECSIVRKDSSSEQTCETMYIASAESGELRFRSEVLRARTEPLSEDTVVEHLLEDYKLEMPPVEGLGDYSDKTNPIRCGLGAHNVAVDEPLAELESCTRNPVLGSADDELSLHICTVSSFNNPFPQPEDEENMKVEGSFGESLTSSESPGDCVPTEETNVTSSSGLEEEQLLFGDIDEFNTGEIQSTGSGSPTNEATEKCLEDIKDTKDELKSPSEKFVSESQSPDFESSTGNFQASSSPIAITGARKLVDEEVTRLTESLPNMLWTKIDSFEADNINCLSHSLDSNSKLLDWTLQSTDLPSSIKSDGQNEQQLVPEPSDMNDAMKTGEVKDLSSTALIGDPSSASTSPGGNWRLWPFSFVRSGSRKSTQSDLSDVRSSDVETTSEVKIGVVQGKDVVESNVVKKMVRVPCPTSKQLASLNMKDGMNTVTFTFLTPMLGKQQVDARIYLWKWNTRIVISDVDGTITRSDVLGQFMPLVGVDWSHLGVAHLFSAIKENGYQLLFLSARAISQAYITRQFLFNLKQDGKALPDGPVVISPDGLFPSLYREVIRRAPHEFKIACLEEIRSLFPSDCNPFYAGFGNRDTDEVSYLKVGIPKGKIFIINPKGEVAVNRRVDTKSYKSIHALVNGMFPPTASSEQEDYNSWNFWKLPLVIDE